jgi:hypothetical protein
MAYVPNSPGDSEEQDVTEPTVHWSELVQSDKLGQAQQAVTRLTNELDAERQAYDQALTDRALAIEARDIALEARDTARRELAEFKQRVYDRMVQEADDRQWCSEFDDILEEFGFERRYKEYRVTFSVTLSLNTHVTARDEDYASSQAREELCLYEGRTYDVGNYTASLTDISVDYAERTS